MNVNLSNKKLESLGEGIREVSNSLWPAQVVCIKEEPWKTILAINYSESINKFTLLHSFLPCIDKTINKIAQYRVFNIVDLCSAYHQVPIRDQDKPYMMFEVCGNLLGLQMGLFVFNRLWRHLL